MRGITVLMSARKRNWFLALLFLGWALGNLDRYIMNYAVLSITEDLKLSASSTGILLSSFFAGYALMQLPGGWLADRFGARKVLIYLSHFVVHFYRINWSGMVIDLHDHDSFLVWDW